MLQIRKTSLQCREQVAKGLSSGPQKIADLQNDPGNTCVNEKQHNS